MRDFVDRDIRPFSQAKEDDLVNLIRNIIGGKIEMDDENSFESDSESVKKKKPKREDDKVDGKSRAFNSAVNRLATIKAKRNAETEGYIKEFSEASIENIAIILAETLKVEQIEELCILLNQSDETGEE